MMFKLGSVYGALCYSFGNKENNYLIYNYIYYYVLI